MSTQPKHFLTPEEYIDLERKAEFKSEYYDGQMYAMSGASERHNFIAGSIYRHLSDQLFGRSCSPYITDIRVRVHPKRTYTYPDVIVVCGQTRFADDQKDTLLNPTLIVEVLSESTEDYDRGGKFERYRGLESLKEYVLVAQDRPHVEVFARQADNEWLLKETNDLEMQIQLKAIECTLRLRDIYERIEFPNTSTSEQAASLGEDQPLS